VWFINSAWPSTARTRVRCIAGPKDLLVEFGENFPDNLGHLVRWKSLAAFGLGNFFRECLDGMDAAHQNVTQGFTARLGSSTDSMALVTSWLGDSATS